GYEAMTMQGVARQAGVGKTTIYRRWPSKQHLVLAALRALQAEVPLVDTGHLRQDLLTMVESALALGVSHPHLQSFALRAATELAAQPALLQEVLTHVLPTRFQDFADLIERAKARGELRADLRSEVAFSLVAGPIYYHWLLGEIVSPSAPRRLAEQ